MGMFRSAETRWFFEGEGNADVREWILRSDLADSQPERIDDYLLLPDCKTAGVKIREGRFEVKAQTSAPELRHYSDDVAGYCDSWVKWSSTIPGTEGFSLDPASDERWVSVRKQRTLRLYSLEGPRPVETAPGGPFLRAGCQVEYSEVEVRVPDARATAWWSFSLEAFGDSGSESAHLAATADLIFSGGFEFIFPQEASMSYPAWLQRATNL